MKYVDTLLKRLLMTKSIQNVCVYCSSSNKVGQIYKDATIELGTLLAEAGKTIIYGGAKSGLMGLIADSALAAGGKVIGVLSQDLQNLELEHMGLTEMCIAETMHTRKAIMTEKSDAFVILPGGLGTLDEMFEMATWRQIGLHTKQIILLNINDYWTPLLKMLDKMVEEHCMLEAHTRMFQIMDSPKDIIKTLNGFHPEHFDIKSKWVE